MKTNYVNGETVLKEIRNNYEVNEIEGMKIKVIKSRGLNNGEALKTAYAVLIGDESGG